MRRDAGNPVRLLLLSAGTGLLGTVAGVALVVTGGTSIGIFLIICGPVGVLLTASTVALSRRRAMVNRVRQSAFEAAAGSHPAARGIGQRLGTGQRADRGDSPAGGRGSRPALQQHQWRWAGGMNIPTATGRLSATFPLAVLEISAGKLVMRIRPGWVSAMVGAGSLEASPGDGTVLFLVQQLAGIGVGIRGPGRPAWYFRSSAPDEILAAAAMVGFEVEASLGRWGK